MNRFREFPQLARHVVLPALGVCGLVYLAYHGVQGERGLVAYTQLSAQITEARANLAGLEEARRVLEKDVGLLRPSTLDRDMLDERARAMLGLTRRDEVLILVMDPAPETAVRPATLARLESQHE